MLNSFRNILIPVDFTFNTELAVKKCIQLMDANESTIHLIHVVKSGGDKKEFSEIFSVIPSYKINRKLEVDAALQLKEWKCCIRETRPQANVYTYLAKSNSVEDSIVLKAEELKPELIIIGRHSYNKWFPLAKTISPVDIAKKTHSAVLIVKPGSLYAKIKSIVIPVRSFFPKRKLELLIPFAQKRNLTVYFLSMLNESNGYDGSSAARAFVETSRLLNDDVSCQIAHKLVDGKSIAKTVFRFAKTVNADVVVVNPEETRISPFPGLDISDLVTKDSQLHILTIDPNVSDW